MNLLRMPLAAVSLLVLLAGCASAPDASSPVGMNYTHGTLRSVEGASFIRVWRASLAALNACDVTVLDESHTTSGGDIDGRSPELKTVKVGVRRLSADKTELRIRVDSFGDSELSHQIYEKFQIALGTR